jgi:hypothetical protein
MGMHACLPCLKNSYQSYAVQTRLTHIVAKNVRNKKSAGVEPEQHETIKIASHIEKRGVKSGNLKYSPSYM